LQFNVVSEKKRREAKSAIILGKTARRCSFHGSEAEMAKRKVKAKGVVADIRAGMGDDMLKEKYGLSDIGLQSVFNKLVDAGLLPQSELDKRLSPTETSVDMWWRCPACGSPQSHEHDECPQCGVSVEKFLKKHAAAEGTKEPKAVPLTSAKASQAAGSEPAVSIHSASNAASEAAGEAVGEAAGEVVSNVLGSLLS
jgi:rubrerythrin